MELNHGQMLINTIGQMLSKPNFLITKIIPWMASSILLLTNLSKFLKASLQLATKRDTTKTTMKFKMMMEK